MDDRTTGLYFTLFTEVGIIGQLSRALFEARLPEGLLTVHFSIVNHLVRLGDGKTPLDIARAFQVPKTSMTHSLTVLERHGFIQLKPNPKDGRSKLVLLTDKGRTFRESAIAALGPDIAKMAQEIPEEDVTAILPALQKIREYLDANRP